MTKNPESAKYASCLARAQDAIRSANEDTIKLSQRFGRMMPKLQRLDSPPLLSWFNHYSKVKDLASKADEEMAPLLGNAQAASNPFLQSQISSYFAQRARLFTKMEVMDDVLNGMIEELLENGSFEEAELEQMRIALDSTLARSKRQVEAELSPA